MSCSNLKYGTPEKNQMRVVTNDNILAGILFFIVQFLQAASSRQYFLCSIRYITAQTFWNWAQYCVVTAINIWKEERSTMEIMVEGSKSVQVAGLLHERDIPYTVAIADMTALLQKEQNTPIAINSLLSKSKRKNTKFIS